MKFQYKVKSGKGVIPAPSVSLKMLKANKQYELDVVESERERIEIIRNSGDFKIRFVPEVKDNDIDLAFELAAKEKADAKAEAKPEADTKSKAGKK